MANIKPIETRYAGCRFRSRLEARWAVFFDALKVKWLYEPQGYVLGNGDTYLPDFWLPDLAQWIEVKGAPEEADFIKLHAATAADGLPIAYEGRRPAEAFNVRDLEAMPSMRRILLLGEVPNINERYAGWPDAGVLHFMTTLTARGPKLQPCFFWFKTVLEVAKEWGWPRRDAFDAERLEAIRLHPFTAKAYNAARAARFEHGESGAPTPTPADGWGSPNPQWRDA